MSGDGVHVDNAGHMVIARAIASACDVTWYGNAPDVFRLLDQRTKVLHNAYLDEVGHTRPQTAKGLPILEALAEATSLEKKLESFLTVAQKKLTAPKKGPLAPISPTDGLPNVLLIGDSISIGYTLGVRKNLKGIANVHRPPTNCGPSVKGMAELDNWLGTTKWDLIHFNFGLHDLKWMGANGENLAEPNGDGNSQQVPIQEYKHIWTSLPRKRQPRKSSFGTLTRTSGC